MGRVASERQALGATEQPVELAGGVERVELVATADATAADEDLRMRTIAMHFARR